MKKKEVSEKVKIIVVKMAASTSIVLKSLSILLGLFFIFIGTMKLSPYFSKELHRDLVSIIFFLITKLFLCVTGCEKFSFSGTVKKSICKKLIDEWKILPWFLVCRRERQSGWKCGRGTLSTKSSLSPSGYFCNA